MKIILLIKNALHSNGFDGLFIPGICGCIADDISPGNCLCDQCEAGYKHTHSVTGDWIVSRNKEGVTDSDIEQCIADCG